MNKPKGLVFITLDCARYDRMSFNGYKYVRHFNMEKFAKKGYVFDSMISNGVQTPQVHASYLTGKYQYEHGLRRMWGSKLNPEIPTIPEMLQDQGWATACATGFTGLATHYGLDRGFEQIDEDSDISKAWAVNKNGGAQGNDWRQWVKKFRYDEAKPLFIWLHYFFGHTGSDPALPSRYHGVGYQRDHPRTDLFRNYDGKFLWFDEEWLPVITDRFDPDEYAYIITADHGDDFGKYELAHGSYLFHETTHIPLIVHPAYNHSNSRVNEICQPTNIIPNVLSDCFQVGIKHSRIRGIGESPLAYSEALIDYDCSVGDGSGILKEKCFRHSLFDGIYKVIYKNPLKLGMGRLEGGSVWNKKENKEIMFLDNSELRFVVNERSGMWKHAENPEILNPVYEASMDKEIKGQLKNLGYL